MYCPTCQHQVAPKTKYDFDHGIGRGVAYAVGAGIVGAVLHSTALVVGIDGGLLYGWLSGSKYKYCPVCFTPLTKPGEERTDEIVPPGSAPP